MMTSGASLVTMFPKPTAIRLKGHTDVLPVLLGSKDCMSEWMKLVSH